MKGSTEANPKKRSSRLHERSWQRHPEITVLECNGYFCRVNLFRQIERTKDEMMLYATFFCRLQNFVLIFPRPDQKARRFDTNLDLIGAKAWQLMLTSNCSGDSIIPTGIKHLMTLGLALVARFLGLRVGIRDE